MVNIDGDTVSEIGEQTLDVGEKCQFLVLGGKVRMKKKSSFRIYLLQAYILVY